MLEDSLSPLFRILPSKYNELSNSNIPVWIESDSCFSGAELNPVRITATREIAESGFDDFIVNGDLL